jgi:hypothetical protein
MHANDLIINNGATRQAVEGVAKLLPHFDGEATTAFVVESVYTVNSSTFMISSQKKEIFWILDFVSKEQTDHFQRLFATVHIVTEKKIVCLGSECINCSNDDSTHNDCVSEKIRLTQSLFYVSLTSGGKPPYSKSRNKSVYCPWTSPQILMGAPSSSNMGCAMKISLAWLHRLVAS